MEVSIPDRYAKNKSSTKRKENESRVSIPDRYAKNCIIDGKISVCFLFQFLIGTLKTFCFFNTLYKIYKVSIPDRYAKNSFIFSPPFCLCFYVSIPDRYAKNCLPKMWDGKIEPSFNS